MTTATETGLGPPCRECILCRQVRIGDAEEMGVDWWTTSEWHCNHINAPTTWPKHKVTQFESEDGQPDWCPSKPYKGDK